MEKKRSTKQTSITIPVETFEKLEILKNATPSGNISSLITMIIEDFFSEAEYDKNILALGNNAMLIPVDLYREVEEISTIGFSGRVDKGTVKVVSIGANKFVAVKEDSIKNLYARVAQLNKQYKDSISCALELHEKNTIRKKELEITYSNFDKRLKALEKK